MRSWGIGPLRGPTIRRKSSPLHVIVQLSCRHDIATLHPTTRYSKLPETEAVQALLAEGDFAVLTFSGLLRYSGGSLGGNTESGVSPQVLDRYPFSPGCSGSMGREKKKVGCGILELFIM